MGTPQHCTAAFTSGKRTGIRKGNQCLKKTVSPLKTQMRQGGSGQDGSEPVRTQRRRMQCGGGERKELQQVNEEGAKQGEGGPGNRGKKCLLVRRQRWQGGSWLPARLAPAHVHWVPHTSMRKGGTFARWGRKLVRADVLFLFFMGVPRHQR